MGKKFPATTYTPDFLVHHNDGSLECVDVKTVGTATQQGELRAKMFNNRYRDIKLTWICRNLKHGDITGWILFDDLKKIYNKNKREKSKNELQ